MTLVIYGYNHKTAPIQEREAMCSVLANVNETLAKLKALPFIHEVMILTTCNRIELCCVADNARSLSQWIESQHALSSTFQARQYQWEDEQAIKHLLRVACGLDSMIVGESQILGQMKQAYQTALEADSVGKTLCRLMETVFATAKAIRHETGLNQYPVSVAYGAVTTLQRSLTWPEHSVLVVGAGSTAQLLLQYLKKRGCQRIWLANRRYETAEALINQYGATFLPLDGLPQIYPEVEAVVSATASSEPIISVDALRQTAHYPTLWIDLAVPRDIDPKIKDLHNTRLYNVDDMRSLLSDNWDKRQLAAAEAEALVAERAQACLGELRALSVGATIKTVREQVHQIKASELETAYRLIEQGKPAKAVLDEFAHKLTQKVLHTPTQQIREAAYAGEHAHIEYAKQLFNIEDL